jgi:hypothetical protein
MTLDDPPIIAASAGGATGSTAGKRGTITLAALSLGLALSLVGAARAEDAPKFADYPGAATYHGRNAAPIMAAKEPRMNRTRIRRGARGKPNFDGHYIIVGWGCGTQCRDGAIIDAITGTVVMLPYVAGTPQQDAELVDYRVDSRLIVLNGMIREEPPAGSHYFEFDGKSVTRVTTIVRPEWSPDAPADDKPR